MQELIEIYETDYNTIRPIWSERLWDSRYKFESTSAMLFLGGYDAEIAIKYKPIFFKAVYNGQIAGVISGHKSSTDHYRLRGLYIFPEFRGKRISQKLIQKIIDQARSENCTMVWAAPRIASLPHFLKIGFHQSSEFTEEGFLYGPNCYVMINLC
jgi:GNAT superfamily N-acetyltransferase